jgi:hypothetical protein
MENNNEEKGVWIVYDLEANRKIQELLMKEKFSFRFDPSLYVTTKKIMDELHLARQCIDFQHLICNNKTCLNKFCPLNKNG